MGAAQEVKPIRAVLDTNVILSALLFPAGALTWLRLAWRSGRVRPLASQETTRELLRVLAYPKFRLNAAEREELLADYLPLCDAVAIPRGITLTLTCRDPHDQEFLELALAGKAGCIVTGDADLLTLARRFPIPIMTPEQLRAEILVSRP